MASASEHLPPIRTTSSPPLSTKPFRFKRKRTLSASDNDPPRKRPSSPSSTSANHKLRRAHHHHRHHHHRSKARGTPPPSPYEEPPLSPDTAFRESLFDALADDEGAQYWEGVYGQPIHTYSPPYKPAPSDDPDNPSLERMTEDEYVAHVRSKMWERSHQHIVEERAKRAEERERRRRREQARRGEGRSGFGGGFDEGIEDALRRGEVRRRERRQRRLGEIWAEYLKAWEGLRLDAMAGSGNGEKSTLKHRIRWPVESGRWEDVGKEGIEQFLRRAPLVGAGGTEGLGEVLKKERVRWHPDKMMQRAGEAGIDEEAMALVTEVFQIVDGMWEEVKAKK